MASVEKGLFAALAGLGLMLLAGQCACEFYIDHKMLRLRVGFNSEEKELINLHMAAKPMDQTEPDSQPLHLDRVDACPFGNRRTVPTSVLGSPMPDPLTRQGIESAIQ